jgi:DNA-binding SARP family transcriptional activator/tetratricopeptide (TPR) repeat protein
MAEVADIRGPWRAGPGKLRRPLAPGAASAQGLASKLGRRALPADLKFYLLGPLAVRRGPDVVAISPGKQQALLAGLLLKANTVVSVGELTEVLWDSRPPPSARPSLQTHVMRLRKSLSDHDHSLISAQPDGYMITVGVSNLDVNLFERSLAGARDAARARSHADAAARLRTALALWRGQALAGIASETLAMREVPRLTEMRLDALEARIDADLHLGRHAEVISELRLLTAANPLRERLHAMLMLALYRDGQQAGALAAYHVARKALVEALGAEPGTELRGLQQKILAADAEIAAPDHPDVAAGPAGAGHVFPERQAAGTVPRQLPAPVAHFTGRTAELSALAGLLDQRGGGTVAISAIAGTAGIGKTALAVHWAHHVANRFPDGQLYVNLRGFGPSGPAMTSEQGARLLLDGLGAKPEQIPADLDAQAALYRSMSAGKRMLIVLDNARDAAHVRPLLPAAPGCLVLVTSRNDLTGLAAADGAHLIFLDLLTEEQSRELLAHRLGEARVGAELAAVAELTALCARLPLAISIVAARAAARPGLSLAAAAADLREATSALDALSTGDPSTDVRQVFSWSCQQLSDRAAGMFRLLSVHPGPDISVPAAASLAGVPASRARQALAELARAHLISQPVPGRYAMHDLLRTYAAEEARAVESSSDRRAACHRVLDHYLQTASAAALILSPDREMVELSVPHPEVRPEELTDRGRALAWFGAERQVLLSIIDQAASDAFSTHAWQLPWAMAPFLEGQGCWHELVQTQEFALAAARELGNKAAQAEARFLKSHAHVRLGANGDAIAELTISLELARQLGNTLLRARAHFNLAQISHLTGHDDEAVSHARRSLRLCRATANRWGEAVSLNAVGWYSAHLGNHRAGLYYCGKALALHRQIGSQRGEAAALDSLGYVHFLLGNYAEAVGCYQDAIAIHGGTGDLDDQAEFLVHLGDAHQAAGDHDAARRAWQHALAILDDLQHPAAARLRTRLASDPPGSSSPGVATPAGQA